jgi:transposase
MSKLSDRDKQKIRRVFQSTGSIRQTARLVRVSRNAVRRALRPRAGGGAKAAAPARASKLAPYRAKIGYLVREEKMSAAVVLRMIQALGYQGGYSILKDYARRIRPPRGKGITTVLDHPPGHEIQMDWSPHRVILGGKEQVVHTGSIILCFSRWLYVRFFTDETLESVIALHEGAFRELGAIPAVATYDNMTTVGFHRADGVWINPAFQAFADAYGFKVAINRPGAKDLHGVVERHFSYIEGNCLARKEYADLEELNRWGDRWRREIANVRVHGTLRERPVDRLERERPFLRALPGRVDAASGREITRLANRDFCVAVDTNRYSVSPDHVGKEVRVRLYAEHLEIWADGGLDCRHAYCAGRHERQVLPEHEQAYRKLTGQAALLEKAFLRLGETAKSYYEGLKRERGGAAGYHLQQILKMADRHGSDVVAGALAYAQRYGAFSADAVQRVVLGKAPRRRGLPLPPAEEVPERVRQWLRACAVENQGLLSYDRLIARGKGGQDDDDPSDDE